MMLYPSIMKLMEKAGNRYSLVIAASKRARTILDTNDGGDNNMDGARSITRAAEEIADDRILIVNETREQEMEREAEDMAKAQALEAAERALELASEEETEETDAE